MDKILKKMEKILQELAKTGQNFIRWGGHPPPPKSIPGEHTQQVLEPNSPIIRLIWDFESLKRIIKGTSCDCAEPSSEVWIKFMLSVKSSIGGIIPPFE